MIRLTADQRVLIPAASFAQTVEPIVTPDVADRLEELAARLDEVETSDLEAIGLESATTPASCSCRFALTADDRGVRTISLSPPREVQVGGARPPEAFSAYLSYDVRADLVHRSESERTGLRSPTAFLTGAASIYAWPSRRTSSTPSSPEPRDGSASRAAPSST